ncbi:hypothetical protein Peur_054046 [Populus x canadensis]
MASHPRRLLVLEQHYANSLKSKMRIWKYFCSSVYTGQSHWRGSIVAIFLPVQCYWEVTAIWHAHINLQLTSPSLGLSFHSSKHGPHHLDVSWSIMFIKRRKEGELSRLLWLWLGNLYGWVHIVEALSKRRSMSCRQLLNHPPI